MPPTVSVWYFDSVLTTPVLTSQIMTFDSMTDATKWDVDFLSVCVQARKICAIINNKCLWSNKCINTYVCVCGWLTAGLRYHLLVCYDGYSGIISRVQDSQKNKDKLWNNIFYFTKNKYYNIVWWYT